MVVCAFCAPIIFSKSSRHDVNGPHHKELTAWKTSVNDACNVCTTLYEHFLAAARDAFVDANAAKPTSPDAESKALDAAVREKPLEQLLLEEWHMLAKNSCMDTLSEKLLPVYGCSVLDAGGDRAWVLEFKPLKSTVKRRRGGIVENVDFKVKAQRFFVYDVKYDETCEPIANASERADKLETRTDGHQTYAQIKLWAATCENEHELCARLFGPPSDDGYVPKRLLDVGTYTTPSLRLIETEGKRASQFQSYITLSYKWGYEASFVLKQSTRRQYLEQIMPDDLPVTFRDAVEATRRLGSRYLWIDALCMMQLDEEEWLAESPKMQHVYGNSYLSLAAVSADNYAQGLFRERLSTGVPPCQHVVHWDFQSTSCNIIREDYWHGEVLSQPLFTRGWVLQERLLAPRIVHFQRRQVFWQCPTLTACEGTPGGLSEVFTDERLDESRWRRLLLRDNSGLNAEEVTDMHDAWRFAVQSYTSCNLTKSSDKLMAIGSVASRMKESFKERYYAGLWEIDFVEQLAWRVVKLRPQNPDPAYRAPSWSWASVDGVVSVPERIRLRREFTMTVPENGINVVLEEPLNETGTLHFASFTAMTELHQLVFSSDGSLGQDGSAWSWASSDGQERNGWCRLFPDRSWGLGCDNADLEEVTTWQVLSKDGQKKDVLECTVAMLAYSRDLPDTYDESKPTYSGIALALQSVKAGQAKTYCRIGLIDFRNLGGQTWIDLQGLRVMTSRKEGEVAASKKLGKFIHFITLL